MKMAFNLSACVMLTAAACTCNTSTKATHEAMGFESEIAWGAHLVTIAGCNDCHSPKTMTEMGPVPDPARLLSGHPQGALPPSLERAAIEQNGYAVCSPDLTAWVGPWGISYAANLTPDESGMGSWTSEQFARAMREGKFKGMENGRMLLPPMPWPSFARMTDAELSAIFAYLKSIPPVRNVVRQPDPPLAASAAPGT